jgi:hypothetical protein
MGPVKSLVVVTSPSTLNKWADSKPAAVTWPLCSASLCPGPIYPCLFWLNDHMQDSLHIMDKSLMPGVWENWDIIRIIRILWKKLEHHEWKRSHPKGTVASTDFQDDCNPLFVVPLHLKDTFYHFHLGRAMLKDLLGADNWLRFPGVYCVASLTIWKKRWLQQVTAGFPYPKFWTWKAAIPCGSNGSWPVMHWNGT